MSSFYDRARSRLPALFLGLSLLACQREAKSHGVPKAGEAEASRAASSAPAADAAVLPLVVFLGDSLSAGLHLPADQAFPALVQQRLEREGTPFRLVNAGVSGDTTAGGLSRVDWLLKQKPTVVVLELGANDGMRGIRLDFVEQNLRSIIAKIRAQGVQVLFLGMRLWPGLGIDYAPAFAELYERVARDTGVAYVPFFLEGVAGVPELNLPDGIHPTEEGHRRITERVAPRLRDVLQSARGAH